MNYEAHTFIIPEQLVGISRTTIEEHLKLYSGYVKHVNHILSKISECQKDHERFTYELGELARRFSFEYNGMKNHEYYFEQLEGGAKGLPLDSTLAKRIVTQWGSLEAWRDEFVLFAKTRGIGWAVLWEDSETGRLLNSWVDEQHLGILNSCQFIFGIDMWEHSYVADYQPSGKGQYISDYLANVNFELVASRYTSE